MEMKLHVTLLAMLLCALVGQNGISAGKPKYSLYRFPPFSGWKKCCIKRTMWIDLRGNGSFSGYVPYVYPPKFSPKILPGKCATSALVKIRFQNLREGCSGCVNAPECGRRMLQIDLFMSSYKYKAVFHVGDSIKNNGYGKDFHTQQNDAESVGKYPHIYLFQSDKCYSVLKVFYNAIGPGVTQLRLSISNHFIRIQNNKGFDFRFCSCCLFALNGQSDNQGPKNFDVYLGLNRIIKSLAHRGYGVCGAAIKWACPCCSY